MAKCGQSHAPNHGAPCSQPPLPASYVLAPFPLFTLCTIFSTLRRLPLEAACPSTLAPSPPAPFRVGSPSPCLFASHRVSLGGGGGWTHGDGVAVTLQVKEGHGPFKVVKVPRT